MKNEATESARNQRVGQAIAEYLDAIDQRSPLSVDKWLDSYADVKDQLHSFLRGQSHVAGLVGSLPLDDRVVAVAHVTTDAGGDSAEIFTDYAWPATARNAGYEILEELGRGGMGVVYRARQISLDREVALKVPLGVNLNADDLRRFRREADAVAQLDHPGIIPIYEVGGSERQPFLSMKLLTGGNLSGGTQVEPRKAASIMVQIADAIEHAHQRGILHRDLKPSNIMLDGTGQPVVMDFGLAKHLHRDPLAGQETTAGTMLGTPAYMAPEQIVGQATTLSDVYSLGAILYALLTGKAPFSGQSIAEITDKVRNQDPTPPGKLRPGLPADLQTICLKCLVKSAEQRYGSAAELARDLRRWLNHEPIAASPPTTWNRITLWCRRHPAQAGLSAALMLTVLGSSVTLAGMLIRQTALRKEADENAQEALASAVVARTERNRVRETLNSMTSTLATEWLGAQRELTDSQQKFLEKTRDYYQELLQDSSDSPDDLLWVAGAQFRLNQLLRRLGDLNGAEKALSSAEEALNRLPSDFERLTVGIERMNILFGRSSLQNLKGKQDESQALLETAASTGRALLADHPDSLELHKSLSSALSELGIRLRSQKKFPESAALQQEAVDLLEKASTIAGEDTDLERQLGIRLLNLGNILASLRKPDESLSALQKSLTIRRELCERHPELWKLRSDLAYTLDSLGAFHFGRGATDKGRELMTEAMTLRRQLVQEQPLQEEIRRDLVYSMLNLSAVENQVGDAAASEQTLKDAISICTQAASDFPRIEEYQFLIVATKNRLAGNLAARHQAVEAVDVLNELISGLLSNEADGRSDTRTRDELERALALRAGQLSELGRHDEAIADWDAAIAMVESVDPKKTPGLVLCRATSLVKRDDQTRGDSAVAKKLVEDLISETRNRPAAERDYQVFYNAACVLSLLGARAADASEADASEADASEADASEADASEAEAYAVQAIELLAEALREGLPWKESIRRDPELEFLRSHPKYAELMADPE